MITANQFTGNSFPCVATAALRAFRFGKVATTANEDYKIAYAGDGEEALGVIMSDIASGLSTGVAVDGIGLLEVNGANVAIAAGDKLNSGTADGIGVKEAVAGQPFNAIALEPAVADGVAIRVLICRGFIPA